MHQRWSLAVAVAITVTLVAIAHAESRWPDLSRPPVAPQRGGEGDAAVVVGIEEYRDVADIPGAVENANDWYSYLTRDRGLAPASVRLLRNREGTVEKMRRFASEAASAVKPGGTLWFVFIGHGAPAVDGRDGLLVGYGAQADVDVLFARSLPQKELLTLLAAGKQAHTVVVIDACFSGRSSSGAELVKGLQPLTVVRRASPVSKVVVLSAGRADEFAGPLPGVARPAFSYLVLGGLRGWADLNRDGDVSIGEVVSYAGDTLRALVKDRTQTPEFLATNSRETLARGAREAGPDVGAMALMATPSPTPARPSEAHRSGDYESVYNGTFQIGGESGTFVDNAIIRVTDEAKQRVGVVWRFRGNEHTGTVHFALQDGTGPAIEIGPDNCHTGRLANGSTQTTCIERGTISFHGETLLQTQEGRFDGTTPQGQRYRGTYRGTWTGRRQ